MYVFPPSHSFVSICKSNEQAAVEAWERAELRTQDTAAVMRTP